ncbi:MAG: type II secretion system F family protein [Spirochaetales bacterium]|nr:type II secretion system F family protein [Spirochaetales bacterium]
MKSYKCRVSDAEGKIREIIKEAGDEASLVRLISEENFFLISYKEEEKGSSQKKYSNRIILDFTDTLALMLRSGLTVRDSLKVASVTFTDRKTKGLLESLTASLNKGISFPDALDRMSADFTPLYRGMVRIGDRTGSMENIFIRLSKYLNDEKAMREKIRGALIYPLMVISVLFLFMLVISLFIFPRLKNSFSDQTLDLVFQRFQVMMLLVLIPSAIFVLFPVALFFASGSTGKMREWADSVLLKIPVAGKIILNRACLNLVFSLEVLTSSGFPIESALNESSSVLSNSLLKEALKRIGRSIVKGTRLSEAFSAEPIWPERIAVWIGVGEASGDVSSVFSQLRLFFQWELDKRTSRIMQLIEPALILLLGAFMILFVILFVVPLFSIFGAVL